MIVIADTGPIYALIDRSDAWHGRAVEWWSTQTQPVLVPTVVLPEVCYLLHTRIGTAAEQAFVRAVVAGEFTTEPLESEDVERAAVLMLRYADLPLGFVDAVVVATAERTAASAILTSDRRHFEVVRDLHGSAFLLLP